MVGSVRHTWGNDKDRGFRERARGLDRVLCAGPNNWKQIGKILARRRHAKKPKWRTPTKPFGSRCNRKRRKNRTAYGCRNPVSVSSRDATGSMNPLSCTRIPHARPSALHPSASLRNKSSLAASSTTTPLILHRPDHLLGAPCLAGMLHGAASPPLTLILRHN
jgi:hypothetical protein